MPFHKIATVASYHDPWNLIRVPEKYYHSQYYCINHAFVSFQINNLSHQGVWHNNKRTRNWESSMAKSTQIYYTLGDFGMTRCVEHWCSHCSKVSKRLSKVACWVDGVGMNQEIDTNLWFTCLGAIPITIWGYYHYVLHYILNVWRCPSLQNRMKASSITQWQ